MVQSVHLRGHLLLFAPIARRLGQPDVLAGLLTVFVPYLRFGFFHETVYRGMLQLELVRRWSPAIGNAFIVWSVGG